VQLIRDPAVLTVSFVRDYSGAHGQSDRYTRGGDNSARLLVHPLRSPSYSRIRPHLLDQCAVHVAACARTRALGVPISKIATLANKVALYNRRALSMVLNEIG